jgi:hypothetical protein
LSNNSVVLSKSKANFFAIEIDHLELFLSFFLSFLANLKFLAENFNEKCTITDLYINDLVGDSFKFENIVMEKIEVGILDQHNEKKNFKHKIYRYTNVLLLFYFKICNKLNHNFKFNSFFIK